MIVRLIAKTLTPIVSKSRILKVRGTRAVVSNRPYLDFRLRFGIGVAPSYSLNRDAMAFHSISAPNRGISILISRPTPPNRPGEKYRPF